MDEHETHVIAYSVYATVQCMCGDAFIVTKVDDPVVCQGCLQVYELSPLEVKMVDDMDYDDDSDQPLLVSFQV